jgi:energy-coupling factor transport system permease protein
VIAEFYKPGESALHRLDPRAKLVLLVVVLGAFFIPSAPWVLLLFTLAIVSVITVFLGPSQLVPPLKTLWPILILIFLLTPPFHRTGAVLVRVFDFTLVTVDGVQTTLLMLLRFLGITFGFFAVVRTLALDDMVLSLRWFRLPYAACLVITITLRMIPTLGATWHNVLDAHRLRSGSGPGVPRRRIVQTYLPVLTSVLIEAVKGIPLLAMALESRGFGRRNPRTSLAELKRGRTLAADILVLAAASAALLWPLAVRWQH